MTLGLWWQQLVLVMAGGSVLAGWGPAATIGRRIPVGHACGQPDRIVRGWFLAIWLEGRDPSALYWRAFVIVGVLGALTTYSALMLECLLYARSQRSGLLLAYLAISLVAGLALVWFGARLATVLRPSFA